MLTRVHSRKRVSLKVPAAVVMWDLDLHRHPHPDLLSRAWKLRENMTACETLYVALAEALDAPIVSCDAPLARTPGHWARIEAIE
jgi:predicted nucleic acid-binding protein